MATDIARALLAGLGGVTPGPWDVMPCNTIRAIDGDVAIPIFDARSPWKKHRHAATVVKQERRNAQHVARCSPENIRALSQDYLDLKASHDAAVAALRDVRNCFEVEYHDDGRIACLGHDNGGLRLVVRLLDGALAALTTPAAPVEGEWREVEISSLLKGRRQTPAYFPATGEVCEVSGPNCDNADGYTWAQTTILWQNHMFVLYGQAGYWPVLHKHEHVLFRRPAAGGAL